MKSTYKILIVDDKKLDRDGVCFLIKQNALPLKPVTAASGTEALKLLAGEHFDILLSDIQMPDINGLELIREASLIQPEIKSVIFSSYDNFQYAQTAIEIGISKYLLKPIKVNDFIDCMNRMISELNDTQQERMSHSLYTALFSDAGEISVSEGYLFLIDFVNPFFNRHDFDAGLPRMPKDFVRISLNEYQCLLIAPDSNSAHNYISNLCNHFHDSENMFLITCGGLFHSATEMRDCFERTEAYADMKFYIDKNEVAYLDDKPQPPNQEEMLWLWKTCSEIGKLVNRRETDGAENLLLELFTTLQTKRSFPIISVKSACNEIVRLCCSIEDGNLDEFNQYLSSIYHANGIDELNNIIYELIHKSASKSDVAFAVQKAIQLIHQNYMEDISLESIATQVYLSPCYFSYLFKKTTGVNFLKYLTIYRVERAKELLETTQLRVGEICERVGYTNRSYFCQIFRNHCGMSPVKYRETAK